MIFFVKKKTILFNFIITSFDTFSVRTEQCKMQVNFVCVTVFFVFICWLFGVRLYAFSLKCSFCYFYPTRIISKFKGSKGTCDRANILKECYTHTHTPQLNTNNDINA